MANRKRDKVIVIRVSEEERQRFEDKYTESGLRSKADFIMALASGEPIVVIDELQKAMVELKRQGNNINQIAHTLNAMGSVNSDGMKGLVDHWERAYSSLEELSKGVMKNAIVQRKKQQGKTS